VSKESGTLTAGTFGHEWWVMVILKWEHLSPLLQDKVTLKQQNRWFS